MAAFCPATVKYMSDAVPDTVTDAVALLRRQGYTIDFQLVDGHLTCDSDARACDIEAAVVDRVYRFEGMSDPGDEMIVFALHDPVNDRRGTLAAGYGPAADPERAQYLRGLAERF
jgi:hypothetical protein